MSEHHAKVRWTRTTPDFQYDTYDRNHSVAFPGGVNAMLSAAAEYKGDAKHPNPEELLVGALSSCHMLTFLAVAAKKGLTVDSYADDAVGVLEKDADGKLSVTRVTLKPVVTFAGEAPDAATVTKLHESAHRGCFIANSVKTAVTVES